MAAVPTKGSARTANLRRSSPKHRRHQHLLDTGVRSSEADRQRQRRWLAAGAKLFIAAALLVGVYFGVTRLVTRTILQNARYNISELDVETDGILKPEDILETADLHKGTNIFRVDLAKAQALVAAIPQVEKVSVSRQLPNRVAIQINERKPVAWIASAQGAASRDEVVASRFSWLVDASGVLLRPKKLGPQDRFLPIIRNSSEGPFSEGQEVSSEEMKAALDLLRAQQESSNTARFQIEEIDLARHFGLVVTDRNGLQVLFGLDEMDRQLKRLDVYLQAIDQRAQKPQSINLLVERNVPVTFVVAAVTTDKPAQTLAAATPSPAPGSAAASPKDKGKTKDKAPDKQKSRGTAKAAEKARAGTGTHKRQPFLEENTDTPRAGSANDKH